jgi:DHA2 family multidrug resistance protein
MSPAHTRLLLIGLGLATGMEFYTFDSVNLVLADLTGTPWACPRTKPAGC